MHERTRATTKTDVEKRACTLFSREAEVSCAQVRLEQTRVERNTSVGWPVRDEQIMHERMRVKTQEIWTLNNTCGISVRDFQCASTGLLHNKYSLHDSHVHTQCACMCPVTKATWFEHFSARGFQWTSTSLLHRKIDTARSAPAFAC